MTIVPKAKGPKYDQEDILALIVEKINAEIEEMIPTQRRIEIDLSSEFGDSAGDQTLVDMIIDHYTDGEGLWKQVQIYSTIERGNVPVFKVTLIW